jgi:hypothetical protein
MKKISKSSPQSTANNLYKIITILFEDSTLNKDEFLSRFEGKLLKINPEDLKNKNFSQEWVIGQSIAICKNILKGQEEEFIKEVLLRLIKLIKDKK